MFCLQVAVLGLTFVTRFAFAPDQKETELDVSRRYHQYCVVFLVQYLLLSLLWKAAKFKFRPSTSDAAALALACFFILVKHGWHATVPALVQLAAFCSNCSLTERATERSKLFSCRLSALFLAACHQPDNFCATLATFCSFLMAS